jgi:outer membrane protein, multidrug efflux system
MRNAMRVLLTIGANLMLGVVLAGCTVGPDYQAPAIATPAHYAEPSAAAPNAGIAEWWGSFQDPTLDRLIAQAVRDNLDVQAAASRIREARQQEIVAGAAAWPTLQVDDQFTRTHLSQNSLAAGTLGSLLGGPVGTRNATSEGAGQAGIGFPGADFNTFQLGFDASWELDLFGKTRRGVEAARYSTDAAVWNQRDTLVSLTAEVADTYLQLRSAQQRLAIAQAELRRQQDLLAVVQAQARGGLVTGLDLRQQETQVASAASQVPAFEADAKVRRHALAVLLGEAPEALDGDLATPEALPAVPPDVPVGLPSELLRRRPDIRAAERQLASATANIGVAVADFYPQITLTASPALVSTALSNLVSWSSRSLGAGVGLVWPIFQAGKTKANVAIADERAQQALLTYRKTVLTALQDVEDALANYAAEQQRLAALQRSLRAARAASDVARQQYRSGLVTFTTVLNAEAALNTAEDQTAQSNAAVTRDLVALYKALGGGWREDATVQAAAQ